jgi:hypothetical protein
VVSSKLGSRALDSIVAYFQLTIDEPRSGAHAPGVGDDRLPGNGDLKICQDPAVCGSEISLKGDGGPTCLTAPIWHGITNLSLVSPAGTPCVRENRGGCPPRSSVLGAVSPIISLDAGSRRQGPALLP